MLDKAKKERYNALDEKRRDNTNSSRANPSENNGAQENNPHKGLVLSPPVPHPILQGVLMNGKGSYVYLFRKIIETSFYKDSFALHLAIHCLLKANRFPRQVTLGNEIINLERGQFITGRHKLYLETGIKESTVRNKLSLLSKVGFLDIKTTTKYSIITVINYDKYQLKDSGRTAEEPTDGQQMDTTKKEKKDKKDNKQYNNIGQEQDPNRTPHHLFKSIIDYLNKQAKREYRATSEKTKSLIRARLREGFTEQDFKTVIDKKVAEWLGDSKMDKYLRPSTLFGPKFEDYLNQKTIKKMGFEKYLRED